MPRQKDLKRLIRSRMQKTGESYTAARAQIRKKTLPPDARMAELAGMSDAAVKAATGRTWRRWVRALDDIGAASMSHREIARRVGQEEGVSMWWAQTVTVGYERIRGLRAVGQRRGGAFEANKTRTIAAPLSRLYRAFSVKRARERWLPDVDLTIRTSTTNRSMRVTWPDGTSVQLQFDAPSRGKSRVAVQHAGLKDTKDRDARKAFWHERLSALSELLAPRAGG